MGSSEDYIVHLLYALSETDMFNESPTKMDGRALTEKEYYELLAKKMNECVGKVK